MSNELKTNDISEFARVLDQIQKTRQHVFTHANAAQIDLYWHIGQTISNKVEKTQ